MAAKRKTAKKTAPCEHQLSIGDLLEKVKDNLILQHSLDDVMLEDMILAAVDYAESRQHLPEGYYQCNRMRRNTERAVIMLSCHSYESRDGSTAGFFGDSVAAGSRARDVIDGMLRLDKDWRF